jgi:hypothetical protein
MTTYSNSHTGTQESNGHVATAFPVNIVKNFQKNI